MTIFVVMIIQTYICFSCVSVCGWPCPLGVKGVRKRKSITIHIDVRLTLIGCVRVVVVIVVGGRSMYRYDR